MSLQVGIDLGGTFTDLVLADEESHRVSVAKVPTTPRDPATGFMHAVSSADVPLDEVRALVHGTTLTTNAVLERTGVRTGLITTAGFRDVLVMARRMRPQLWGLKGSWQPLVPRHLSREVDGRIDAEGNVLVPLDRDQVGDAAQELIDAGCKAIVVSFLHSYQDPSHEQTAATLIREQWPDTFVVTGSEVLPQVREFDRTATAAVAAYVGPLIQDYVGDLSSRLRNGGLQHDFFLMQGNGGVLPASEAGSSVVTTVLSGPAAGVIAACEIGAEAGHTNLITCDLGGTSLDIALIRDGVPGVTTDFEIGFNTPLRVPLVDIRTVGAGGGSLASVDGLGVLRVGPASAGADPGPICYGRGGTQVTLTDANAMLGRIVADRLPVIEGGVSTTELERAFQEQLGHQLGLDGIQAAEAVIEVANASMAGAIRRLTIEQGHDPRDFALLVHGGAGPLHGVELARQLSIPTVIVPYYPGLTSAIGCLFADLQRDTTRHVQQALSTLTDGDLRSIVMAQETAAGALIDQARAPVKQVQVEHSADLQYAGQTHLFRVPLDQSTTVADLKAEFDRRYQTRYSVDLSSHDAVLVNVRSSAIGIRHRPDLTSLVQRDALGDDVASALKEVRPVRFGSDVVNCPVYERHDLPIGAELEGPAVLDQIDSTVLLPPDVTSHVTKAGSLVMSVR